MEKYKRIKSVTLPVLSFKERQVAYVKVLGEIHASDATIVEGDTKTPAMIMQVLNLEDGQGYEMICPVLLVTALTERERDYVGRCYEINVSPDPRPGKQYKDVTVYQIECPDGPETT